MDILSPNVNVAVFAFFALNTLLLAYLGGVYMRQKSQLFKLFGFGLLLNSVAFLFWTYITGFQPNNLDLVTSTGVIFFIGAFAAFFVASVSALKKEARKNAYIIGGLLLAVLIALRFFFYQSDPGFSPEGFFSFNTHMFVLYAYVLTMAFTFMPAVYAVSEKVKSPRFAYIIRFGFTVIVIGTAILITSPDNNLQIVNGIGMSAAFLLLAVAHARYQLDGKAKK